jgi:hypothetical protein
MDESIERSVLKSVQRKFPVCNVIDARTYDGGDIAEKCNGAPYQTEIKLGKLRFSVMLCTGSFNVYVLKIEDIE